MSNAANDRNLLVGILALQMDFISQTQLIAGIQAWVLNKSEQLEELLMQQNAINREKRDFLNSIVQQHLKLHDNDAGKSLASLSSISSARRQLAAVQDVDIEETLSRAEVVRQQKESTGQIDPKMEATFLLQDPGSKSERFRILRPHAMGGLGMVSVAEDTELHREVALKEIQGRFSNDIGSRNRFMIEAEITGRLEHPGIVPVYSLGRSSTGHPFYVMRFIRGDSLKDAISSHYSDSARSASKDVRAQALRKLLRRLVDVCNAIEYAHSRGVLHRDLKPGNIMLGKYGETLVVDWGLAKTVGRKGQHDSDEPTMIPSSGEGSTETRMGTVVGTLAYMSPEQAAGRLDELGPAADVYCLGGTLYCMLTGMAPIEKAPTEDMLKAILSGQVKSVRQLNPAIDPALEAICSKAMSLKPSDRYASSAVLAEELERWLADEPVHAYPEPLVRRLGRSVKRHRSLVASTIAILLVGFVSLLFVNGLVARQNRNLKAANDLAEENRILAEAGQANAEEKLGMARNVTLNLVQIAEKVLSQNDALGNVRESVMDEAFTLFTKIHQESPNDIGVAEQLAKVARIAGNQKVVLVKLAEAESRLRDSLSAQQLMQQASPLSEAQMFYLAETYRDLTNLLIQQDRLDEASTSMNTARQILSQISSERKDNSMSRSLAWLGKDQVKVLMDLWELNQALEIAKANEAEFRRLLTVADQHDQDQAYLTISLYRQGRCLDYLSRTEEAMLAYDKAIAEARKSYEKSTKKTFPSDLVRSLIWSAEARSRKAPSRQGAEEHIAEARELLQPWITSTSPANLLYYWAEFLVVEAQVAIATGELDKARTSLNLAVPVLENLILKQDASYYSSQLSTALSHLSDIERASNNIEAANQRLLEAVSREKHASELAPRKKEIAIRLDRILLKAKENGAL